jgi:hypothetical protein
MAFQGMFLTIAGPSRVAAHTGKRFHVSTAALNRGLAGP